MKGGKEMNKVQNIILSILIMLAINACAKGNVKVPANYLHPEKKYAVVGITCYSKMDVDVGPSGGGVLPYLAKQAATSKGRDALGEKLSKAMGDWKPEEILRDRIYQYLSDHGRTAVNIEEIVPVPSDIVGDLEEEDAWGSISLGWYNPDKSVFDHSQIIEKYQIDAIIEVGYARYYIEKKRGKYYLGVHSLIKVVKPNNGEVIGRRVCMVIAGYKGRGLIGEFDLNDESQILPFVTKFKTVFEDEVRISVKEGMEKLGL
jgi:hypothetical protein